MRKPKTVAKSLLELADDAMGGTTPDELFRELMSEAHESDHLLKLLAFCLDLIRLSIVQGILPQDVLDQVMREHGDVEM